MTSASASVECAPPGVLRVAVLVSGRGSNLGALIEARDAGMPVNFAGVFSDRSDAPALERARAAGIPTLHIARCDFSNEISFQTALFDRVAATSPDLIVCAGFMRVIRPRFIDSIAPMINIHPSLLPRHRGLNTHQAVLDAGEREHGASVHRVTPDLDAGPVIAQVRIDVHEGEHAESLSGRLLPLEHRLLVACVGAVAVGELCLPQSSGVRWLGKALILPLRFDSATGRLSDAADQSGRR